MNAHRIRQANRRLRKSIDSASGWRGAMHPDDWDEFDAEIAQYRKDLKMLTALARSTLPAKVDKR